MKPYRKNYLLKIRPLSLHNTTYQTLTEDFTNYSDLRHQDDLIHFLKEGTERSPDNKLTMHYTIHDNEGQPIAVWHSQIQVDIEGKPRVEQFHPSECLLLTMIMKLMTQ